MPAPVCQLLYCTAVLFKVLHCKIEKVSFILCVFIFYLCEKYYKPLSVEFSRQEYWSGLPFLTPGDLPNLGIKPTSLVFPELSGRFSTTSASWEAHWYSKCNSSYFIFFLRDLTHSTEHSVDNYCLGRRNNTGKAGPALKRQRGVQGDTQPNENNGGH